MGMGTIVGCTSGTVTGAGSPLAAIATAHVPGHTASPSRKPTSKATSTKGKPKATKKPAVHTTHAPTGKTVPPTPATSAPATDPTTSAPDPTKTTPSADPTQTAQPTQSPTTGGGGAAFTADCPAQASSSAPGCGSWDAGPNSGQAPGFLPGTQSSANYLDVNQDPWTGSQGPQDLTAYSFANWSVTATDTDPSDSPGEVLTYPDASYNYYQLDNPPQYNLNNITTLTSDFTESMPNLSSVDAEAAYDIWLNNWDTEVMVWVATSPGKDRNLADSGDTEVGTYTFGGENYSLWTNGTGINGFYIFLLDHSETSGTVDLLPMLQTLVSKGWIPANSPLTEIPFGWEISDTGGQPATFSLSRFDVTIAG